MAALYLNEIELFVQGNSKQILGTLVAGLAKQGFDTNILTAESWQNEISALQSSFIQLGDVLPAAKRWAVLLEYVVPIIGQRLDCVLLANNLIFVIEYKGGNSSTGVSALRQAQEYALNLLDFHEESRNRVVIPIAVGSFRRYIPFCGNSPTHQGAAICQEDLSRVIVEAYEKWGSTNNQILASSWDRSRYFPVPTIIEAASSIYLNHNVANIAYSRSGVDNLNETQNAVVQIVDDARKRNAKILIVITGVPGAGKTLAGLNAVQTLQPKLDLNKEQASFLSGNGPLVKVLQVALKRSISTNKGASRAVQSRIRDMHRFIKDSYCNSRAPADRLIVFDEAQRAWTSWKNKKKFGHDKSEPEMVLEIMGRHDGWAVVIALVGGGQEIHSGEAGLSAWGSAIQKNESWEVASSPEALRGGISVAGSCLFGENTTTPIGVTENKSLHLSISKRSFTTEVTTAWVNEVLRGKQSQAKELVGTNAFPIYLSRNLDQARSWLRNYAKGERRSGLIASSGAARLRAEGVETPTFTFLGGIDYTKWFLEPVGDYRSSNQLEVALSEFELQGLEIDLACLLWGGDLVFDKGAVVTRRLSGQSWVVVDGLNEPQSTADDPRTRILNKYRVLLTRFRKGMIIYIPEGSITDPTRKPDEFNSVYNYFIGCGLKEIPDA